MVGREALGVVDSHSGKCPGGGMAGVGGQKREATQQVSLLAVCVDSWDHWEEMRGRQNFPGASAVQRVQGPKLSPALSPGCPSVMVDTPLSNWQSL